MNNGSMFGMSVAPIPTDLLYAQPISAACGIAFPPLVAYAIACRESIISEMNGKWNARTIVSSDGGHGLFQLTSSYPASWDDPQANAAYAVRNWLLPDMLWWRTQILGLTGDDLIRCIAASFNAGRGGAWEGHLAGDVDRFTEDGYGGGVVAIYNNLLTKGSP